MVAAVVAPMDRSGRLMRMSGEDLVPCVHTYGVTGELVEVEVRTDPARAWSAVYARDHPDAGGGRPVHPPRRHRRVGGAPLTAFSHIGFGKPVSFGWLTDDFGPDGYVGDPTGATAEHGEEAVFDAAAGRPVEVIEEARRWPGTP